MGYDTDGKTLGVCRGYVNGDIIPGKYRLGSGECHIPYKLKEYVLTKNFEVLTLPQTKMFSWVTIKNGQIPTSAVPGGREAGGIPLYIGRCFKELTGRIPVLLERFSRANSTFPLGAKSIHARSLRFWYVKQNLEVTSYTRNWI